MGMAKAMVMRGSKEKTSGGLKKDSLRKNKGGKIVSKKASDGAKKRYAGSAFQKWTKAWRSWAERLPRAVPCTPRRRRSTRLEEIIGKRTLVTFCLVMCDRGFSASRVRRRHWLAA